MAILMVRDGTITGLLLKPLYYPIIFPEGRAYNTYFQAGQETLQVLP
jgi:hypothetical protein